VRKRTILGWLSVSLRISSLIVLLPFTLKYLNSSEFLFWQLMQSFVILGIALDFGMTPTFSRYFSYALGLPKEDAEDRLNKLYATLNKVILFRVLPILFFLIIFGFFVLFNQIKDNQSFQIVFLLYSIMILFQICVNSRIGVLIGIDKIELVRAYEIIFNLLQISLLIIVLYFTSSLVLLVITHTLSVIFSFILLGIIVNMHGIENGEFSKKVMEEIQTVILKTGSGILISQILIQAPPLLLSNFLYGPKLSEFLIFSRIVQALCQISNVFIYQSMPLINKSEEEKDLNFQKKLIKIEFFKTFSTYYILSFILFVTLPLFINYIPGEIDLTRSLLTYVIFLYAFERILAISNQLESVKKFINWSQTYLLVGLVSCFSIFAFAVYSKISIENVIISLSFGYFISIIFFKFGKIRLFYGDFVNYLISASIVPIILFICAIL